MLRDYILHTVFSKKFFWKVAGFHSQCSMSIWCCISIFSVCLLSPVIRYHKLPRRNQLLARWCQWASVTSFTSVSLGPMIRRSAPLSLPERMEAMTSLPASGGRSKIRALKPHPSATQASRLCKRGATERNPSIHVYSGQQLGFSKCLHHHNAFQHQQFLLNVGFVSCKCSLKMHSLQIANQASTAIFALHGLCISAFKRHNKALLTYALRASTFFSCNCVIRLSVIVSACIERCNKKTRTTVTKSIMLGTKPASSSSYKWLTGRLACQESEISHNVQFKRLNAIWHGWFSSTLKAGTGSL